MIQWLRLQTSTARGSGLVLGWGAEIPPAVQQREIQRFSTPISSTINTWHQLHCSMFVTTDDPTLAQNYLIKPTVFTRIHSLCCRLYGF